MHGQPHIRFNWYNVVHKTNVMMTPLGSSARVAKGSRVHCGKEQTVGYGRLTHLLNNFTSTGFEPDKGVRTELLLLSVASTKRNIVMEKL